MATIEEISKLNIKDMSFEEMSKHPKIKEFVDTLSQSQDVINAELAAETKATQMFNRALMDSYVNPILGLGNNVTDTAGYWEYNNNLLNWRLNSTLYENSWVFRNGIDKIVSSALRGINIVSSASAEEEEACKREFRKLKNQISELLTYGRIYGGAAGLMLIEGLHSEDTLISGLDLKKIKKGAKISLYSRDRWSGLNWHGSTGPEALGTVDFLKPREYGFTITSAVGGESEVGSGKTTPAGNPDNRDGLRTELTVKAHYSFVLRAGNRKPTIMTKHILSGWDIPESQHVIEELKRDETIRGSVASLISKSLIEVVKMSGIRGLFTGLSGGNSKSESACRQQITSRLEAITSYRNFNNMSFLDKEDEYQQFQFSAMTGMADILHQSRKYISGAMNIPEMILYGSTDKKGLEFQGEGKSSPEVEVYQHFIDSYIEHNVRPIYDKLLPVLWRIANGKDLPDDISYTFEPVFRDNPTEITNRTKTFIETLGLLKDMGVYDAEMTLNEIRNHSREYNIGSNITDEHIKAMKRLEEEARQQMQEQSQEKTSPESEPSKGGENPNDEPKYKIKKRE